ncbi:chromosome partition protein Smc [Calothrix sp. NIES-4071]|nr:chromosome partition protein Smc [Calothrix sp. NIES-4071]BAZ58669.1 chromosome partition protein Smc [Calothrix sp. NIES-4105]
MKLHTDVETAKQLEELWHTIERGITVANQAAQQAGAIHAAIMQDYSKIEQLKLDTSSFAHTIQDNIDEVKQQQLYLEDNIQAVSHIRHEIISQLEQIGDYQTRLDAFKQELKLVIDSVDTTKNQAQQLEAILPAFTKDLPQQLEQINQLAVQIETNKQEIAKYQEKTQHQANEGAQAHSQIQTLKTEIETVITNFGGKQALDNLHLENQSIQNKLQQAQTEIERLHQKLETQTKKQKQFNNWLLALSVGVTLTLIFTIMR